MTTKDRDIKALPEEKEDEVRQQNGAADGIGAIPRTKDIFGIVWLALCCIFMLTMLASGFNFFPLVGLVLSIVAAVALIARTAKDKPAGLFLWVSVLVIYGGTFLYFLIWGADSFGKRLWWNLVLLLGPVGMAVLFVFLRKFLNGKALKGVACAVLSLMIATTGIYALFMNLRARPVVDRLWEGHDAYLSSVSSKKKGASPNVLVILMDDMAYADISAYSYLTGRTPTINTPYIDSIAENGVMMENFYAASPVCSPSRFAMLTGRYSSRGYLDNVVFPTVTDSDPWSPTHFLDPYQFLFNVDGILGDEVTFAEVLQAAGYDTACIGKWNLGDYGEYLPTNQGFDYFYGSYYVNDMTPYNWVRDTGSGHPEGVTHAEVRTHAENLDQSEEHAASSRKRCSPSSTASVEQRQPLPRLLHLAVAALPHLFRQQRQREGGYLGRQLYRLHRGVRPRAGQDPRLSPFHSRRGERRHPLRQHRRHLHLGQRSRARGGNGGAEREKEHHLRGRHESAPHRELSRGRRGRNPNSTVTVTENDGTSRTSPTLRVTSSSMNFDIFTTLISLSGVTNDDGSAFLPSDRIIDGADLAALWRGETDDPDASVHDVLFYQKKGKTQAVQMIKVPVETEHGTEYYDFKYYDRVQTENSAFIDQYYVNYLFNLDADPIEGYNVSMVHPDVAEKLAAALDGFRDEMKSNRRGIL